MAMFSGRSKALSLYKRGMKKAKNRDLAGAVEDYTLVIKMPNVPNDVKSMALFNRALAFSRDKDYSHARADLEDVLATPETPAEIMTAAQQKVQRMQKLDRS